MLRSRRAVVILAVAVIALSFLAVTWARAGRLGFISEEVQPYLARYPRVLERDGQARVSPMPPYDRPQDGPRWVSTSQWPVVAYDGRERMWPLFIRGHESALGAYPGILLGPWLGPGMLGVRRADVLIAFALLVLVAVLGARLRARCTPLAVAIAASSYGLLWMARTGYGFELASRVALVAALILAAPLRRPSLARAAALGAVVATATLCRATTAVTLGPALGVLFFHPQRAPRAPALGAFIATALALPLLAFGVAHVWAPFRAGEGALATFPFADLVGRVRGVPRQVVLQLAWLGDPVAVLAPILRGDPSLGWPVGAAAIGAVPFGAALWRWRRGRAGDPERMLLWSGTSGVVLGALMYGAPHNFQLALGLEPLFALAVSEQIASLSRGAATTCLAAAALLVRVVTAAQGFGLEAVVGSPSFSTEVQRAASDAAARLGISGARVATTTYNQVGVLEAWSSGRQCPWHAWKLLQDDDASATDAFRVLIGSYGVDHVLFSEGNDVIDNEQTRMTRLMPLLSAAAGSKGLRVVRVASFPTEAGTSGWALYRVEDGSGAARGVGRKSSFAFTQRGETRAEGLPLVNPKDGREGFGRALLLLSGRTGSTRDEDGQLLGLGDPRRTVGISQEGLQRKAPTIDPFELQPQGSLIESRGGAHL